MSKAGLSESEAQIMLSQASPKIIRKKQFILQEGEIAHYHCFVEKGLLRAYRMRENGDEHIIRFAPEYYWIGDQHSMRTGEPSKFYFDAIEDSEVVMFSKESFAEFLKTIPKLKEWSDALLAKSAAVNTDRIFTNIGFSAEEKYLQYVEKNPDLVRRIPLHMLASYLGVTRETLSRIRKKLGDSSID